MKDKSETLEANSTFSSPPYEAVRLLTAIVVLLLTAAPIDANHVSAFETDVFEWINDLPGTLYRALWAVMQLGNVVAVPVVALIALFVRRFWLAAALALSGSLAWLLAKSVKSTIERGPTGRACERCDLAPCACSGKWIHFGTCRRGGSSRHRRLALFEP